MKKNNESGAALFLVILFAGLSMGVVAGLNSIIQNNIDASSNRQFKRDFNIFVSDLNVLLNNPQTCSNALNGVRLRNLTVNDKTNGISLRQLGYGSAIQTDFRLPNGDFRVFDVGLHLGPSRLRVSSGNPGVYYMAHNAKVIISAEECVDTNANCQGGRGAEQITNEVQNFAQSSKYQEIELVVFLDNQRRIQTCYGRNSLGTVCEYSGGVWNINENNPRFRCNPYRICFVERIGGTNVRSAPNRASATCNNSRYSPEIIGMLGGTIRYFCEWCNVNAYNP